MAVIPESDERILRIARITDPPGLRLEGEVDATVHHDVTEALSTVVTGSGEVRLDCAGLSFIDLGALRLLTGFVEGCDSGARLVLDHLSPDVESLIETVGWERLPGLVRGRKEMS